MARPESLQPCRCPSCEQDLIITCPNRCANAIDGTGARLQRGPNRRNGQTREKVLQALEAQPCTARELARRLEVPGERISVMLTYLKQQGILRVELPPGRKYNAIYHLVRAA